MTTTSERHDLFVAEGSQIVRRDPESVIATVLDPSTWPSWQPEIVSTEGPAPLASGDIVHGRARMLGFGVEGRSIAVEAGPVSFEEDVVVGVRMRVRYEARRAPEGTVLVHRLEADLPTGPAGRALALLLRRRLKKLQRSALSELARRTEATRDIG